MPKITDNEIQQIFDNYDDREKALKEVKKLLILNNYKRHGWDKNKIQYSHLESEHTIVIDIKKYSDGYIKKDDSINKLNTDEKVIFMDTLTNRYAEFSGRARRSEYWTFVAVSFIIWIVSSLIFPPLGIIVALIFCIPHIAVSVRRIHDIGLSGLWGWLFIPLAFPMLIVGLIDSKEKNIVTSLKMKTKKVTTSIISNKLKPKDMNEVADALLKFKNLLDAGVISQKEFNDVKKELLNKK